MRTFKTDILKIMLFNVFPNNCFPDLYESDTFKKLSEN